MKTKLYLPFLFLLLQLTASCAHDADVVAVTEELPPTVTGDEQPICFASEAAEDAVETRSNSPLHKDFYLYGFKVKDTYTQTVFPKYLLRYVENSGNSSVDNTSGYYYVGAQAGQTVKYWDRSASCYLFCAYCPEQSPSWVDAKGEADEKQSLTEGSRLSASFTVNLTDVSDLEAAAGTTAVPLYTDLQTVADTAYGNVVRMRFKKPATRVGYRFIRTDGISETLTTVSKSTFAPLSPDDDTIYTSGTITVTHSYTDGVAATEVSVAGGNTIADNAFTEANKYYNVLPASALQPYGPFRLTALVGGVEKTATVPAEYMQWLPNATYTYVFKIIDNGMTIVFVEVQVTPWAQGGTVTDAEAWW